MMNYKKVEKSKLDTSWCLKYVENEDLPCFITYSPVPVVKKLVLCSMNQTFAYKWLRYSENFVFRCLNIVSFLETWESRTN